VLSPRALSPAPRASAAAPQAVHDVLRSPWAPLDALVQAEMEPRSGHSFADVRVHARAEPAPVVKPRGASSPRLLASRDPAAKRNGGKPAGEPLRFRHVCVGTESLDKEEPQQDTRFEPGFADSRADRLAEYFEEGQWLMHAAGKLGRGRMEPEIRADLGNSLSGGARLDEGRQPDLALAGGEEETAGVRGVIDWMVKALTAHTIPPRVCGLVPDRSLPFPGPAEDPSPARRTPQLHSDLLSGRRRYSGSLNVPPLRGDVPAPAGPVPEGPALPPSLEELLRMSWRIARPRRRRPSLGGAYNVFRSAAGPAPAVAPPIVHDVLRSSGAPLDSAVRARMEPRLGHSFADVRVHTDARAAESARAVGAHAYAAGTHVVFGAGRYAPGSAEGQRLIAHELAHVVQQRGAPSSIQPKLEIGAAHDPAEREAEAAARAAVDGGEARVARGTGARVARQEADAGTAPSCPVVDKGTVNTISWGETSGLYPTSGPGNLYKPALWDQAKLCDLLRARRAAAEVGKRNKAVHTASPGSGAIEQMLKKYHFNENFPALDTEIADAGVKWFFLSSSSTGPAAHPGATGSVIAKTYGSFYNTGGGDVKKGDTWIHFYKLAPKPAPKGTGTDAGEPPVPSPSPGNGRDNPSDQVPP
jgi:hypothetical protein